MSRTTRNRWLIYVLGCVCLAMGLALNTKAGLGVSPILSVSYSASVIWGWSLGNTTLVTYCVLILGQFVIRGENRRWRDLLQLPFSLIFSRVLDVLNGFIVYDASVHSLAENLGVLAAATVLTGIGAAVMVNMDLISHPGDAIVQALAQRMGKEQGVAKNIFDVCCVIFTACMTLVCAGEVVGISLGTVIAMVCIGRVVSLVNHLGREKMCRAAGLT